MAWRLHGINQSFSPVKFGLFSYIGCGTKHLPQKNGIVAGDAQEILQLPFNSTGNKLL
jgi:hypothetical protein